MQKESYISNNKLKANNEWYYRIISSPFLVTNFDSKNENDESATILIVQCNFRDHFQRCENKPFVRYVAI